MFWSNTLMHRHKDTDGCEKVHSRQMKYAMKSDPCVRSVTNCMVQEMVVI